MHFIYFSLFSFFLYNTLEQSFCHSHACLITRAIPSTFTRTFVFRCYNTETGAGRGGRGVTYLRLSFVDNVSFVKPYPRGEDRVQCRQQITLCCCLSPAFARGLTSVWSSPRAVRLELAGTLANGALRQLAQDRHGG